MAEYRETEQVVITTEICAHLSEESNHDGGGWRAIKIDVLSTGYTVDDGPHDWRRVKALWERHQETAGQYGHGTLTLRDDLSDSPMLDAFKAAGGEILYVIGHQMVLPSKILQSDGMPKPVPATVLAVRKLLTAEEVELLEAKRAKEKRPFLELAKS